MPVDAFVGTAVLLCDCVKYHALRYPRRVQVPVLAYKSLPAIASAAQALGRSGLPPRMLG